MANLEAQKQSTPPRQAVQDEESDPIALEDNGAPEGASQFDFEASLPPMKVEPSEDPMDVISDDVNGGSDTFVTEPLVAEYYVPTKVSSRVHSDMLAGILTKLDG